MNRRNLILGAGALVPYGGAARAAVEDVAVTLGAGAPEDTRKLQTAIDRGYGRRLNLLGEGEVFGLTIDPAQGGLGIQVVGRSAYALRGSSMRHVGAGDAISIRNLSGMPYNGPIVLRDFGLFGSGSGANGIHAEEINGQFRLEGLWLHGHGAANLLAERCYSMEIRGCLSNSPGTDGVAIIDAGNNVVLDHLRSFGAKKANIRIGGKTPALAPVLIAPDVSGGAEGLVVENAHGVAITGFYSEESPVAARFAADVEFTIQGGLVQNGLIEARGPGAITAVHFRGKGGLRAGPGVVVTACSFVSGATRA